MADKKVQVIYEMIAELNPGNLSQGIKKINDQLKGIKLSDKMTFEYKEALKEVERLAGNFETSIKLPLTDDKALQNAVKDYKALEKSIIRFQNVINKAGLDIKDFKWLPDHKDFTKFQLADQVGAELKEVENKLEKTFSTFKNRFRSNFQKTAELGLNFESGDLVTAALTPGGKMPYSLSRAEYAAEATLQKEIAAIEERRLKTLEGLRKNQERLKELKEGSDASGKQQEIETLEKSIEGQERSIELRNEEIETHKNDIKVIQQLRAAYEELKKISKISAKELAEYAKEGESANETLLRMAEEGAEAFREALSKANVAAEDVQDTLKGFETPLKDQEKFNDEVTRGEQEMKNLQSQLLNFFSVSNGWNLEIGRAHV